VIRAIVMTALLCATAPAMAADDLKVSQLEQDVRDLQRQVQMLSRQIEAQRQQLALRTDPPTLKSSPPPAGMTGTPAWLDAAKWRKLMPGMSELEVIGTLGPPTSIRTEAGRQRLMYALEIGSTGFLSGSVTLRDRAVVEVQLPVLQ
jgi:hypothetical protein